MNAAATALAGLIERVAARQSAGLIGVAVSGGGDSIALLQLLADYGRHEGREIIAATIDHGLRAASADESGQVAQKCAVLGVRHSTLRWHGWDGAGNLQDAARAARYRLLGDWARANQCHQVWLGHTADDQSETFLLRLARGSGVDGLSAMPQSTTRDGIAWVRPLLTISRQHLREYLTGSGVSWSDDPSNADPRFERIRFRNAAGALADLGLTRERLNATAAAMARARVALERATDSLVAASLEISAAGEVFVNAETLAGADDEIRLRLMARALNWVSGAVYRPRLAALEHLADAVAHGTGSTLHGCVVRLEHKRIVVRRELARVAVNVPAGDRIWDGRWVIAGPVEGLTLGAVGSSGLEQIKDWRAANLAREALMTTPALWRGNALVAAPVAGLIAGFSATFCREFAGRVLSR